MRRVPLASDNVERAQAACFICELVAGNREYAHHVVHEDADTIAFLNRYPAEYGHVLVAPKQHREEVTGDFEPDEYLAVQRVVHSVGEAVRRAVAPERLYVLSLGSRQANRHVHWNLVPLPPGVPFEEQQLEALRVERGVLEFTDEEQAALAEAIRSAII